MNMDVITITDNDLFCFILKDRDSKNVYISFRGSFNLENWLRNIDIRREKLGKGQKIHSGFWNASIILTNKIFQYINQDDTIHLTGHSLGGSLCQLSANILNEFGYNVEYAVSFESPNYANKKYIKGTQKYPVKRIIIANNMDIVVMLPLFLKKHRIDTIYFNKNHKIKINPSAFSKIIDRGVTFYKEKDIGELWNDHDMMEIITIVANSRTEINYLVNEGVIG